MKYPCIESTIDCFADDYQLRLWIDQKVVPKNHTWEIELIPKLKTLGDLSMYEVIEKIVELVPDLNAVQVKRGAVGTVIYTRAFSEGEDPHG